ncbi:hypothetical protein CTAYLR_000323 [Chrysophaeum taylorii]|uniref:PPM-type phosphatase domain-containing protein n=1 Tax=Chrysophaeum taylorii TaxID=2483200 RepID=A0AAD7UF75_9STRA|nr:hypothetical protein CTAYLR_000323 [Chrysophaeum taylorii]
MGNRSSCCTSMVPAAKDRRRPARSGGNSSYPYESSESEGASMPRNGEQVRGVSEREGFGEIKHGRVARWRGSVWPSRMDMDRFGFCVRERDGEAVVAAGIFDGHGIAGTETWGHEIAEAAAKHVVLGAVAWRASDDSTAGLEKLFENFQRRHEQTYDEQIAKRVEAERLKFEQENGFSSGPRSLPAEGGTTATVVVVRGDEIVAAWVGDSRAVLCRVDDGKLQAVPLTVDHNVGANAEERDRCEAAGGMILGRFVGAPSADGMLQVTRSLGDRAHHEGNVVLSKPEIATFKIDPRDSFIVVASDGIWESLPQLQVLTVLHRALAASGKSSKDQQRALETGVEKLFDKARDNVRKNNLKQDDCSVVVLVFRRQDKTPNR